MKKAELFTLEDVQAAWKKYEEGRVLRVLRDGRWETVPIDGVKPGGRLAATSAAVRKLSDTVDFPTYLGDMWKK